MKFKLNKVAAAVAVSLGTSVVGLSAAQADEILFPYVVRSSTVTTILSVINDDDYSSSDQLHYRYYYKSGLDVTQNDSKCQEADYREKSSPNDVVTFDISGEFGDDLGVLYEPTAAQIKVKYDKNFSLFRDMNPVRAFAVVDNNDKTNVNQDVYGEAFIIEFANGASWGYRAYNAAGIYTARSSKVTDDNPLGVGIENPFEFTDRVETAGEVLVARPTSSENPDRYWTPITLAPFGETSTRLFVTPIGTAAPFQLNPTISSTVKLEVSDPGNSVFDVMYDRDENPISGQMPQKVVCVGAVFAKDMISQAAQQFVNNGGWSNVSVTDGQAIVIKLEYNDASPAQINGQDVAGFYNNATWLRKGIRESLQRPVTTQTSGRSQADVTALTTYAIAGYEGYAGYQEMNSPFFMIDADAAEDDGVSALPPQDATPSDYLQYAVDATTGVQ